MSYNCFVYGLFCNLYVYSFSIEFFCKSEKILIKKLGKYVHVYNIILPKVLDTIEVIDTISIAKHNNTKKSYLLQLMEKISQENLVKFTNDKKLH